MKKTRLTVAVLLAVVLLFGMMTTAFAASYTPVDPDDQGKTGIVGGDTLTFSEDTVWASLTARWGVRVIFRDADEWSNAELQNQLLPVTDGGSASTTAPEDPAHEGWTFVGWERVDENDGAATLNDDGTVTGINGPGPIIYQAVYEPIPPQTGSLTISKTVTGTAGDTEKAFTFTVTLGAEGTYGYTGSSTGRIASGGTVQLKHGESVTISGLPEGTAYAVAESDNDGYEVTRTGDTGTIAANSTATAAFTNTKDTDTPPSPPDEPMTGSLTISKTVNGDLGEKDKYFSFKVEFDAEGSYSYTGSRSGTISSGGVIQLKHGESVTIGGLPAGTKYSVTESGNTGYRVSVSGDVGVIAAEKTCAAKFTNTKSKVPITGDNSNMTLWISLLLASVVGIVACVVLFRKKKHAGKHMQTLLLLVLAGMVVFSGLGATTAFAADDGTTGYTYGQYDMTYLPGTTDTVTNMPANETGLTPGSDNPYTVSSTVPVREGFEFIDWALAWGTMEAPPALTDYVVKYLDVNTNEPVADEKTVTGLEVGTYVAESAISVDGYTALEPTEATLELAETGNEIIFYYQKLPVLTDYTVKYLDVDTEEPVAPEKGETGLEVGTSVSETAIGVDGYAALDPTEATLELAESGNEIIFYYQKLTSYTVRYLYLYEGTDWDVDEPKIVTDVPVGDTITEYAREVFGFIPRNLEITFTLKESGNEVCFYYYTIILPFRQ